MRKLFTDRFIKLPIKLVDGKMKELGIDVESENAVIRILPDQICQYFADFDPDEQLECINITLKCGDKTNVYMSIEEFEELLNAINE